MTRFLPKNLNIKAMILKTEGMVKLPVVNLKPIRNMIFRTISIYNKQHMTWIWIQYVTGHCFNMCYHTGNLFCIVV